MCLKITQKTKGDRSFSINNIEYKVLYPKEIKELRKDFETSEDGESEDEGWGFNLKDVAGGLKDIKGAVGDVKGMMGDVGDIAGGLGDLGVPGMDKVKGFTDNIPGGDMMKKAAGKAKEGGGGFGGFGDLTSGKIPGMDNIPGMGNLKDMQKGMEDLKNMKVPGVGNLGDAARLAK